MTAINDEPTFDAIVVGSGMSGGWAAKELTERGLKVLLLERGKLVRHGVDYIGEDKPPWEFRFRGLGDRQDATRDYPIQSKARAFGEGSSQWFVNDRKQPYVSDPDYPFDWIRGYQTGGKSLTWGRATPRLAPINFEEPKRDGHGIDWPIRYEDLAPWYSRVEKYIGVCGSREGLDSVPDGEFVPPMPLNAAEIHLQKVIAQRFPGRSLIPERSAIISVEHNGRAPCHYCGPCFKGCSTASYYSSNGVALPAAQATGLLTMKHDTIVAEVVHDPATRRATGVRTIDARTGARTTHTARLIFLAASTVGTAHILLQSRSEAFPTGLANRSDVVGRYLMDHAMGPLVIARFAGMTDERPIGNRPNGIYIPRFANVHDRDPRFVRGYGFQGRGYRQMWTRGTETDEIGVDLKKSLRSPGPWHVSLVGFGECLPDADNRVTLDPQAVDRWNLPQARIRFKWGENEHALAREAAAQAATMLRAAGGEVVYYADQLVPGGLAIHEMGTARMGRDPATSALNGFNQAHDVSNLFVIDGACMPATGNANPSLTYMALTSRAVDYAVARMKLGRS